MATRKIGEYETLDAWQGNLYSIAEALTWQQLQAVGISIISTPTVVANWILLDSRNTSVISTVISGWILLDSRGISVTVALPATNWVLLDSRSISITPAVAVTNWVLLNQASVSIVPTEKAEWQKYIPWVAGAGAVGLAIYAIKKSQED